MAFRSIRTVQQAILITLAIVILAMWMTTIASVQTARQAALDRAQSEGGNLAVAFADEVARILDGVDTSMGIVAQRMRANPVGRFDIHAWASEIPLLSDATIQRVIIGPDGMLHSTTLDPMPAPLDLSDREHFRVHLDGKIDGLFVGKPVLGRVSNKVTIQTTRRVDDAQGRFLGVIMFALSPAQLTNLHRSIDLGPRGVITLAGLDNIVRARFTRDHPDGLSGIGASLAGPDRPSMAESTEGSYIRKSVIDGIERLYSNRRVADYPLVVSVGLDMKDALAAPSATAAILIVITGAATLLLVGLGIYLVREIRRRAAKEDELAAERCHLETEVALRRDAEQLIRDALDSISEGFAFYDADDRLVMCNEAYRQMYPTSAPAIAAGARFEDLLRYGLARGEYACPSGEEEAWLAERLREHRRLATVEQQLSDGRWLLISERPTSNGGIAGLRVDITALKTVQEKERQLTQQLLHSQKLKALGTLAGGVAHDLNNTLVPIVALSKLALQEVPDKGVMRDDLETIVEAGEHARDLVRQILAFSRKQELARREIDLDAVVHDGLRMLRAGLPATISLIEEISPVPPLLGDPCQLQNVLVNLVTNAAQAITTGIGTISVRLAAHDGVISLSVSDTGVGMEPQTIERIFEPFYTTKIVGEGTGLGLSVVYGIVTGHAGRIEVRSAPGEGTTFTVLLPITADKGDAAELLAA